MKRSRLAPLLALALVSSACQFRACGLGCGSNASSNIPATPAVEPQPLQVPDPIPGEHGLAALWFDNTEGLLAWGKGLNPEKFPQELSPKGLREIIVKQTGSPQLASGIDFTRPFGCVGFNVMEFMQGSNLPLSCVFHFKGGLSSLETALSNAGAKMEDDRLLASIRGRDLSFRAWPATDAVWLTGGKKLAMQAKPVLQQKLAQSDTGHKARVELSVYVAQILDDYKVFARPMIKSALKEYSAALPLESQALEDTIDKTFNELENLHEFRTSFKLDKNDIQLYFSQSLAQASTQLTALGKTCDGPGMNPHLLGLIPDNALFVFAQNLNLSEGARQAWTKESHEVFRKLIEEQENKPFPHSHEEVSAYIHQLGDHLNGNLAASIFLLEPKAGAFSLLYRAKSADPPRKFWSKSFQALVKHLPESFDFSGQAEKVAIQGVNFDRYRVSQKPTPSNNNPAVFSIDVGELDGIGIVLASKASHIDAATNRVVGAMKGKQRFGDTPSFKALAGKFAGNHIGMAANLIALVNADRGDKKKLKPQGLGDLSLVIRGVPGKGMAMQCSLNQSTIQEASRALKSSAAR